MEKRELVVVWETESQQDELARDKIGDRKEFASARREAEVGDRRCGPRGGRRGSGRIGSDGEGMLLLGQYFTPIVS